MKTILITGFPGSGKSTLVDRWLNEATGEPLRFVEEQSQRMYLERDLVLGDGGTFQPRAVEYRAPGDEAGDGPGWKIVESRKTTNATGVHAVLNLVDAPFFLSSFRNFVELGDDDHSAAARRLHVIILELIEGIGAADWVVLNKCDLLSPEDARRTAELVGHFHPDARVLTTRFAHVHLYDVQHGPARSAQSIAAGERSVDEFQERYPARAGDPALVDFVYRVRRPFHPERLWRMLETNGFVAPALRGFLWLATRMTWAGYICRTPSTLSLHGVGHWLDSQPPESWPETLRQDKRRPAVWQHPHGDRRQDIGAVIFDGDQAGLQGLLDACLLTDAEYEAGPDSWRQLPDPFPVWRFEKTSQPHVCTSECRHTHEHAEAGTHH
jgi:G3E family GTPase